MGQTRSTGGRTVCRRATAFSAAVAARLNEMRACVDTDLAVFGAEIMHRYRIERLSARLVGNWAAFRHADDKLTYLHSLAD